MTDVIRPSNVRSPCPACRLSDRIVTFHIGADEGTVTCQRCRVQTYGAGALHVWNRFPREFSGSTAHETSEPRRLERIAAHIAHGILHILDDSEENAQTGVVSLEISGEDWQELNRVIELLGNDPHEVLHNMIGVNS